MKMPVGKKRRGRDEHLRRLAAAVGQARANDGKREGWCLPRVLQQRERNWQQRAGITEVDGVLLPPCTAARNSDSGNRG